MKLLFTLFFSLLLGFSSIAQNKKFDFIAFGDMPYKLPEDYGRFEGVIRKINQEKPVFSVHVGDIKSGSTPCSTEYFNKIHQYFEAFDQPLVYTPGDNEWTDCNRKAAGEYDPNERLKELRKVFFAKKESFGKKKIKLVSQSENPTFANYVENNTWEYGGIQFATIHLVGSNNNLKGANADNTEFNEREKANEAWLEEVFAKANSKMGLVFFTQADMFYHGAVPTGFTQIVEKLTALTRVYGKPVLWINGDSHRLLIEKPLLMPDKKSTILNFTRLQVFGEADMEAVRVKVDPKSSQLFLFEQLMVD
ncbi:metallophosphoesterase [Aquirufa salirivi]|uniref:Metallophosphoesterase n=1 Tax=Aquirufa salirivi TaxID=3104729 RepID=A0ABW8RYC5_9BACT